MSPEQTGIIAVSELDVTQMRALACKHLSANVQTRPQKPASRRDLLRRPAKPARLRGRVQLAAERVLFLYGTATTSDIIDYSYSERRSSAV